MPEKKLTKYATIATLTALGAVAGLRTVERSNEVDFDYGSGPAKEYVVKNGDNPWSVAERAFPNVDPRLVIHDVINPQIPKDKLHQDGMLHPSDVISLPNQSEIGKVDKEG